MKVQPRQRAAGPQPLAHLCGLLRHFLAALSLLCIALAGCTVQRSGRRGLARQPGCQRSAAQAALRQANHGAGRGASGLGQRRRGCGAA